MTRDELIAFIDETVAGPHDYNTSADAMWKCAVEAFNYAADQVGATGFQAGYAALAFLREVNHWDFPFAVIKGEEMLYPQYDIPAKVAGWLREWRTWAGEEARKRIAEHDGERNWVSPAVWARWEELAAIPPKLAEAES